MYISLPNTNIITKPNNNIINDYRKENKNISFKAAGDDSFAFYSIDFSNLFNNPVTLLHHQLIKDGYSSRDIENMNIFSSSNPSDKDITNALLKDYSFLVGNDNPSGVYCPLNPKTNEDVMAMLLVYGALSKRFKTQDVQEYNKAFAELDKLLEDNFGIKTPKDKHIKDMVLEILKYTNRHNVAITEALLNDKNFNNTNIVQAIMGIQTIEQADAAKKVLHYAQEVGYDKEFSLPLSVMLCKANQKNLPAIIKALGEQEFLTDNKDFVPEKLIKFLSNYDYLTISYMQDEALTLRDISDLLASE